MVSTSRNSPPAENRLIRVEPGYSPPAQDDIKLEFAYDYMGRRIEKRVYEYTTAWQLRETRRYLWAGWLLLAELDGSNNVVRKQTWGLDLAGLNGSVNSRESAGGIGGLLAIEQAAVGGGSTQGGLDAVDLVVLGDANGNVTQLVAWASGYGGAVGFGWHTDRLAAHYEYTPYGGTVCDPGDAAASGAYAAENPWRFSTKQWDDEHGTPVGYWGYRYYDPRLGRWLSRDPIGEEGGRNLYACVANSPSGTIDSDGRRPRPFKEGKFDVMWGEQGPDKAGVGSSLTVRYTLTSGQASCCKKPRIIQMAETEANIAWWPDDMRKPHIDGTKKGGQRGKDAPSWPFYDLQRQSDSSRKTWVEIDDEPGLDVSPDWINKFSQSFEACVVCTNGPCKGTILGCRTYGHTWDKEGKKMKRWGGGYEMVPQRPSKTFRDLLKKDDLEYTYGSCGC